MRKLNNRYTVAVVIPNWNGEKHLPAMLDSLLAQTFTDFRVLVVDDQSTDRSIDILKEYAAKDDRICYFVRDREPKGAQTCRNCGFEFSEGAQYVVFFDHDDLTAPYCLEQRVRFMDLHPELDFAIFPALDFKKEPYHDTTLVYGFRNHDDPLKELLNRVSQMTGWTNIFRRSSYVAKGLIWDEELLSFQDTYFNIQSIIKGCKFDFADDAQPDYFYRHRSGSISSVRESNDHAGSHAHFVTKVIERLSDEQLQKYQQDVKSCYLSFMIFFFPYRELVVKMLDLNWIRKQRYFSWKLKLWLMLGHKYRILQWLFSKELKYYNSQQEDYRLFRSSKIVELKSMRSS